MMIQIPASIPTAIGIYVAVFVLLQILTKLALRGEPTAHGQIVGRQIGCIVALFWPIAVPFLMIFFAWRGLCWLGNRLRGKRS